MLKSKIIAGIILLFGILILSACENLDLGKLSEEDINKLVVCKEPYMRFAAGCCLDKDSNAICDVDEQLNAGTIASSQSSDSKIQGVSVNQQSQATIHDQNSIKSLQDIQVKTALGSSPPPCTPQDYYIAKTSDSSKKVKYVTSLFIFSEVSDETFQGEGFFAGLADGGEVFIYADFDDNPGDIANTARKLSAYVQGEGQFSYSNDQTKTVFVTRKYDLNSQMLDQYGVCAEHNLLAPEKYYFLADQVIKIGNKKDVKIIYYKDLTFPEVKLIFSGNQIKEISNLTGTTGGSVYLFTVYLNDNKPLNIVGGTIDPKAKEILTGLMDNIQAIKGTDGYITVTAPSFQEQIYTFAGVRTGWTAFYNQVYID